MQGGDLRKALTMDGPDRVTWWKKGKQIACDVARGLAFLHSNKVIHSEQSCIPHMRLTSVFDMS